MNFPSPGTIVEINVDRYVVVSKLYFNASYGSEGYDTYRWKCGTIRSTGAGRIKVFFAKHTVENGSFIGIQELELD